MPTNILITLLYLSLVMLVGFFVWKYVSKRYSQRKLTREALKNIKQQLTVSDEQPEHVSTDEPVMTQKREQRQQKAEAVTLHKRAEVYAARGNTTEAKKYLLRALSYYPEHLDSKALLAQMYLDEGDFAKSVQFYEDVLAYRQSDPELLTKFATALFQMQNNESTNRAIEYLERAATVDVSNPVRHQNVAETHLFLGNFDKAAVAYESAIKRSPRNIALLTALSDVYMTAERYPEAKQALYRLLDISPQNKRGRELWQNLQEHSPELFE